MKTEDFIRAAEYKYRTKSAEIRIGLLSAELIQLGNEPHIVSVIHDITERKQAEAALSVSEAKYRLLYETMAQGIVYQDGQGKILSANSAAEKILGLTLDQMQGRTSIDPRWRSIHEDGSDFPGETHPAMVALREGRHVSNVVMGVFNPETNEYRWININAIPQFRDGESAPYQVYTTFDDITERKQAETALRESRETLAHFINQSPIYTYIKEVTPTQSRVIYASENFADMIGIPGSVMIGKTMEELFPAEFAAKITADDWAVASGKEILNQEEELNGRKYITIKFPLLRTGRVNLLAGYTIDITERKQAEGALRESEERFRQLITSAPDVVFLVDQEGKIMFANLEATNLLGYAPDEFIGMGVEKLIPPQLHNGHIANRAKYMSNPHTRIMGSQLNLLAIHKDGKEFPVDIKISPVNIEGETHIVTFMRDITERKQAEEKLIKAKEEAEESETRFRKSLEFSPTPMAVADHTGKMIFLNQSFIATYGYTLQDTPSIGQWMLKAYPDPEYRNFYLQLWKQDSEYAVKNNTATPLREGLITCKSGEVKTVAISIFFEKDLIIGHFLDISERKQAEDALRLEQAFVNNALDHQQDTFFLFDFTSGKALRWNRAFREISGYSDEEIAALPAPVSYYSAEDLAREHAVIQRVMQGEPASIVMNLISKDGSTIATEYQAAPLKDKNGEYRYIVAIGRDITERVRTEGELRTNNETLKTQFNEINTLKETLQEQAIRDPLTRLHNRRYLDETLAHEMARAKRENYPISIMLIDIDRFKNFNDTYGHSTGDEVLRSLSRLLVESIRQGDIACRYGGEEFLIVMVGPHETDVERRAEKIRHDFNELRIRFENQELSATVSIGVSYYPRHSTDIQQVIKNADAAMYQAKQKGRNRVYVWGT
ncbi:MAG: PAS domain S-box protein [Chloroflexi bacterium]|nr:PAS domain S-box protein [Chloroflexota bacterium]